MDVLELCCARRRRDIFLSVDKVSLVDKERMTTGFLPARFNEKKRNNKRTDNFERLPVQHDAQPVFDVRGGGSARANLFYSVM